MTRIPKCPLCVASPRGIEGHDRLILASGKASGSFFFECASCATLWSRSYEGSGTFVWVDVTTTVQH
jgi:hypothetical protein